mmetsp:Transcript_71885/g.233637  ORF Transcript_71885/g.233637 Transcript_71885/m.233637 type:complete len:210 (+) Transcript_71885:212-841(+)
MGEHLARIGRVACSLGCHCNAVLDDRHTDYELSVGQSRPRPRQHDGVHQPEHLGVLARPFRISWLDGDCCQGFALHSESWHPSAPACHARALRGSLGRRSGSGIVLRPAEHSRTCCHMHDSPCGICRRCRRPRHSTQALLGVASVHAGVCLDGLVALPGRGDRSCNPSSRLGRARVRLSVAEGAATSLGYCEGARDPLRWIENRVSSRC